MAIINNLEDLEALIKLAKEHKVQAIKVDGVEFALYQSLDEPKSEELSEEDLLFASVD